MDRYAKCKVQLDKDRKKESEAISIRLKDTNQVRSYLMLTQTDLNRLSKSSQANLSKTQLKNNKHILELIIVSISTAADSKDSKIKKVISKTKRVSYKEEPVTHDVKHDLGKLLVDYEQNLTVRET